MFKNLFLKELHENIVNRKFFFVSLLVVIIIPLGFYVSYNEYLIRSQDYQDSLRIYRADHKYVSDIMFKEGGKAFRKPSRLSFLSQGLELFLPTLAETYGRTYGVSFVELRYTNDQSQDYLYDSLYGPLDLSFIVSVIMAFLALIVTYNSVSGEKEKGTLGLVLSNSITRSKILLAKMTANMLLLFVPFFIALLAAVLLLQKMNFVIFGTDGTLFYIAFAALFSLLFIGAFLNLGILVSAFTKRAITAVIALLVIWVMLFGLFPLLSVIISQIVYPVKSYQLIAFEKNQLRLNNQRECEAEVDALIEEYGRRPRDELYGEFTRQRWQTRSSNDSAKPGCFIVLLSNNIEIKSINKKRNINYKKLPGDK